jgi:hypothetical protein
MNGSHDQVTRELMRAELDDASRTQIRQAIRALREAP